MQKIIKRVILSFVAVAALALTVEGRPGYIECANSLECGLGYCCTLGSGRFSLPQCLPLGKENDMCRPSQTPLNVTVSYPDGENVLLDHVYSTLCPCEPDLYCSEKSGTCIDPFADILLNKI